MKTIVQVKGFANGYIQEKDLEDEIFLWIFEKRLIVKSCDIKSFQEYLYEKKMKSSKSSEKLSDITEVA
jgi:hypothetical protein